MKKIFTTGLIAGFSMLIVSILMSFIFNQMFPALSQEYSNTNIMRPFGDPIMSLFYLQPFFLAIILSFVWSKTKSCVTGNNFVTKGLVFAAFYILITLPGMLITWATFKISFLMVATWTVSVALQAMALGIINAKINK